jgi:membrane-associated protease RseP (regulator of RpoE activity)
VWTLLMLFALINIFIGVFNLMPLLPFDGGHVVVAVYEKAQEWRLHLRQRYFADVMKLMPLTYLVVLLLAGIFVTTLYLDIAKPITSN